MVEIVNPRADGGLILNQRQAAQLLGRSVKTVRRYTQKGIIPHVREDGSGWPVYSYPALVAWLEELGRTAA